MNVIHFICDYAEGAHPNVLKKLEETNLEQTEGYGEDRFCRAAAERIKELCAAPEAQVHFLTGGTQANLTVIAAALRPYEGVIAAESGHIACHETGAIEASGHKVLTLPARDGKISAGQVERLCREHAEDPVKEHTVKPGMVYLSNPTELGTLYRLEELEELSQVCRKRGLTLYLDGARLGYGLAARGNDVSLPDIARLCDAFYLGGTKQGALFGEAVVLCAPRLQEGFRYHIKQRGGMLAKGRLLGLQFLALLEDGLYWELSQHADRMADRLREGLREAGCPLLVETSANMVFPILPDAWLEPLARTYTFSVFQRVDGDRSAVRFCTSWATRPEYVERLAQDLRRLADSTV